MAVPDRIEKLCGEAAEFGFATVCVNPVWVAEAARLLRGLQSYAGRAIVAPALVLILIVIAERSRPRLIALDSPAARAAIFGLAWFIALIAPALSHRRRNPLRRESGR